MPTSVQPVDWLAVAAPLLVAVLALLLLVLDAFLPAGRRQVTGWLAGIGLLGALALLVPLVGDERETFCVPGHGLVLESCSYEVDDLTLVFQALVLAPLERDDDRNAADEPWDFLQVIPASGPLTVLVEEPSKGGDRYWNAAPRDLDYSSALLQFVDLFDWDVQGFRDMSLVMVWMPQGPAGAGLDSRYALFERQSVTVVVKDMAPL